jgi:basic membrane lipoprotein Med (substrate-binding protein (PBP1-ABC) superfamily)
LRSRVLTTRHLIRCHFHLIQEETLKLKNASAAFALLGASALVLSGCAAAPEEEPAATSTATATEEPAAETIDYLACAVSDEGSWNDKSFNESVYDGLVMAETQLGTQIAEAESNSAEDFQPNLQAMVDQLVATSPLRLDSTWLLTSTQLLQQTQT